MRHRVFGEAAQFATDGEVKFLQAYTLYEVAGNFEGDYRPAAKLTEARAAVQEALKKGVKKPGEAWMVVGRAEFGLGNKAGLIAAYKEAAKHPETAQQANDWLRKNGGK
jgi:hypothetical protein